MASLAQRRYALQAANEVLGDLDIDQEQPVDVFAIVEQLGLFLVFNRLDNLLGAVIPKGTGGIMITDRRGPAIQRYTAAHEIGHWILDFNEPAFDAEDDIFYPDVDRERLAQLFAGQLLMPPPLVFATCSQHGISGSRDVTGPALYLVARDMGASYEAAARQLSSLDIIDPTHRDYLLTLNPAQVKTELCHGHRPRGTVDVWPVDLASTGGAVSVTSGDEVVLLLPENQSTGHRWLTHEELEARSSRRATPPPPRFADESSTAVHPDVEEIQNPSSSQRTNVEIRESLARLPGNQGRRRILRGTAGLEHARRRGAVSEHPAESGNDPTTTEDALNPLPAETLTVDDHFATGWAEVRPSEARGVRQAIAGRSDLLLPDALRPFLTPSTSGARSGINTRLLPIAATGERILALGTVGEGQLGIELIYSSMFDPEATAASSFAVTVTMSATPELLRRRQLIEDARRRMIALDDEPEER